MNDKKESYLITPAGLRRLQREFCDLKSERSKVVEVVAWAAGNGDRSENGDYLYGKKRLREIDRRLEYLSRCFDRAEAIDPARVRSDRVLFGATVEIRDEDDVVKHYTIVGTDESDPACGRISFRSPVARALMNGRADDVVTCETPKGRQELEIVSVKYLPVD